MLRTHDLASEEARDLALDGLVAWLLTEVRAGRKDVPAWIEKFEAVKAEHSLTDAELSGVVETVNETMGYDVTDEDEDLDEEKELDLRCRA